MTFEEMQVKWSVTLTNRLGPEMLTVLEIKGQDLHRVQKVRLIGCVINFSSIFAKKQAVKSHTHSHPRI